jgi:hypothetical protein
VKENDRQAVGRPRFGVGDFQDAGIDVLQRTEGGVGTRLNVTAAFAERSLAESSMPSWAAAAVTAAAPMRRRRWTSILSKWPFMVSLSWLDVDQPNVKANASTPGPKNSISNCRSAIGSGCRISVYIRCSVTVPRPCSSTSTPWASPGG